MKKLYKPISIFCTCIIFIGLNSCDILEKLFVNLKMSKQYTADGSGPDIFEMIDDCLTNYDVFNDNADKIKSLKYVTASYRTVESTPVDLGGTNISATLYDCNNNIIFQEFLPSAQASAYINDPYELQPTESQIASFDAWLLKHNSCTTCSSSDLCSCFTGELRVEQVTPTGESFYSLTGIIEIVIQIEAEL